MAGRLLFLIVLLCSSFSGLFANQTESARLVERAWEAWRTNDHQQVEELFLQAAKEDETNARAYLGLSYLYNLQSKPDEAWQVYQKALQHVEDSYPYIFAAWATPKMRDIDYVMRYATLALMEDLTETSDQHGILTAMAYSELGTYYQNRGALEKARDAFHSMNTTTDWMMIGPFENISASGFDKAFPPEQEYDPKTTYKGKSGVPATWFEIGAIRDNYWIDFRRYFAFYNSVFYANTFVFSPQKQVVQIRVGTSGSLKTFLNDEPIIEVFDENNNDLDTYMVETELQEGWNRLLIKCGFSEIDQCNFMLRITDAAGRPINSLKTSIDSKDYSKHPGASVQTIENFAESYFKERIAEHPEHIENYLLLADCYLRNDKAIEAELVLRDAVGRLPESAVVYHHLIEAYLRGEKYDEYQSTMEQIHKIDDSVPKIMEWKIERFLENEDIENAEELLTKLQALLPESETVLALQMQIYEAKKQYEELMATSTRAYEKYPNNWAFVYLEALFTVQRTQRYEEGIKIIEEYLRGNLSLSALSTLAEFYLQIGRIDKWEKAYRKALSVDPAATGYYNQMANVYVQLQDYEKAEQAMKQAMAICPNSSDYWSTLGRIYRVKGKTQKSIETYRKALEFGPTDYDARAIVRELEGKKSIFSHFRSANVDSLIAAAPGSDRYPEDGAAILLRQSNQVLYPEGASEASEELIVKLYNTRGVDDFKQYRIPYNAYSQVLVVERAVTIKPDGLEIKADESQGLVVFKSAEPSDVLHLKWRIKNYYSGRLSGHFWDTFYFNAYYPVKESRYALLAPAGLEVNFDAKNTDVVPSKVKTDDGILQEWSLTDEPAIKYEYLMPALVDIGKTLHVSTIADWAYMVDWYQDLAKTKTRSSHEIEETVGQLLHGKEELPELEKTRILHDYVAQKIRYSSVPFLQSGLIPQEARDVLVTKIGDCKDKATLLIAMLQEIDIEAHFVLLNTVSNGRIPALLPSIPFNHAIIVVETQEGPLYLDATDHDFPLGCLPLNDVDGFALRVSPQASQPFALPNNGLQANNIRRISTAEVQADNTMRVSVASTRTGTETASFRRWLRDMGPQERMKELGEVLNRDHGNAKLLAFTHDSLEALSPTLNYNYDFELQNYVTDASPLLLIKIPWADALTSNEMASLEERKYPINYWTSADTLRETFKIKVPAGYAPMPTALQDTTLTCANGDYRLSFSFENGMLNADRHLITKKRRVLPEAYSEFRSFYSDAKTLDHKQIVFQAEVVAK